VEFYFSHGTIWVYDSGDQNLASEWTEAHYQQKVCRRAASAGILTLLDGGRAEVELVEDAAALESCELLVEVSVLCVTGRLRIVSVAPKIELWTGAPGWTRLGIGQDVSGDALRIRVVVKEAASEEPTRVRTNGTWAEGPLVETAEAIH